MTDLKGRWALVTGASRGIGKEISIGLAKLGCNVALHSRKPENTSELETQIKALGVEAKSFGAELSDRREIDSMLEKLPIIDVLYNNAAIQGEYNQNSWEIAPEAFETVFRVNTASVIYLCSRLAPGMLERKFGRIVNVTSGIRDQPQLGPYAVSKGALDKYTKDYAMMLEDTGVEMNLLDPGWLRTDMGGPNAPGDVSSVIPGALVPVLIEDGVSGRWFSAQDYVGQSLEQAVEMGESLF